MGEAFSLESTYLALDGAGAARLLPVGPDFWERIEETAAASGTLVMVGESVADWSVWEMHPAGDEVLYLLSGAMEIEFDAQSGGGVRTSLAPGEALLVPKGVWHTAHVARPSKLLSITYGAGTEHRPRGEHIL
ncbi:MAG: cupin domain-containing protein [Hyphomonadaceae bacterium]|nr:cupin domain-containing protein [Hyphomonadaceae bacterium]